MEQLAAWMESHYFECDLDEGACLLCAPEDGHAVVPVD